MSIVITATRSLVDAIHLTQSGIFSYGREPFRISHVSSTGNTGIPATESRNGPRPNVKIPYRNEHRRLKLAGILRQWW